MHMSITHGLEHESTKAMGITVDVHVVYTSQSAHAVLCADTYGPPEKWHILRKVSFNGEPA
jgi:hypothetical protein